MTQAECCGDCSDNGPRPISVIAAEIYRTWPNVNYAAKPYLSAMRSLTKITDSYGYDDAKGIVLRFLGNSNSYRGEDAGRLKAELRSMLK